MPELFGAYTIREELGAGGMASVHLAEWRPKGGVARRVALKRLYLHVASNPELVSMFIDEARLARYLKHPNIAQVYEFGRFSGTYYIAFEFVPGPTVQQVFEQCDKYVGYIPIPLVLEIGCQLCDALHHAHNLCDEDGLALGIVHRDISPSNMILSNAGFVKLIDFGLAKAKQSSHESQSGIIKGKLGYVAPEYIDGRLDVRCDLWAVGVVLHELLCGRRLFESNDAFGTLDRVRKMPIPPPSRFRAEVTSALDDILLRALERDPNKRWQSAASLRAALAGHARQYPLVTKSKLVSWVEWAFAQKQKTREDSGVSALHEMLETGGATPPALELDEAEALQKLPATSAAMMERRRESVAAMHVAQRQSAPAIQRPAPPPSPPPRPAPPKQRVMMQAPPSRLQVIWPWLFLVFSLVVGGIVALLIVRGK